MHNSADPTRGVAQSGKQSKLNPLTGYEYWARDYPTDAWYGKHIAQIVEKGEEE